MANEQLVLMGVPIALGANEPGAERGPAALRAAGLRRRLAAQGRMVRDLGDIAVEHRAPRAAGPRTTRARHLEEVRGTCERLRHQVELSLDLGALPIVLGGDHSIAMGTLAGIAHHHARRGTRVGVLWLDAHGDANTLETSPSGNLHGVPLAVALGLGEPELLALGPRPPMIDGARTALVGLRELDPGERDHLRDARVEIYDMSRLRADGVRAVMQQALARARAGTAGLHVSIDIDCLDPGEAPGVSTPVPGGLTLDELRLAMQLVARTGAVRSVELAEVNPRFDPHGRTAAAAVELLATLLAPASRSVESSRLMAACFQGRTRSAPPAGA